MKMDVSSTYSIEPDLPTFADQVFPDPFHVVGVDEIRVSLSLGDHWSGDQVKAHMDSIVERELNRLSVMSGRFYHYRLRELTPELNLTVSIDLPFGWTILPARPESIGRQSSWNDELVLALSLWRKSHESYNQPPLAYSYLLMICEILGIDSTWPEHERASGKLSCPISETRQIRNLILHAGMPSEEVVRYASIHGFDATRNSTNRFIHLEHARRRLPICMSGVWRKLCFQIGYDDDLGA